MVRFKTRLFQDPEEMKSASSFMWYCINVCLPIHVMRNVNTKQLKVINTFYKDTLAARTSRKRLGKLFMPLSPSSITWHRPRSGDALWLGRCLAESNGSLPPDGWLIVTCGLTACTPGLALGPMLGNEYGKPLPFTATKIISILTAIFYINPSQLLPSWFLPPFILAQNLWG